MSEAYILRIKFNAHIRRLNFKTRVRDIMVRRNKATVVLKGIYIYVRERMLKLKINISF
jgi:hypothetical protein